MQSTICLVKFSNSPPLEMQCAHNNQEDFTWVAMWAKVLREMSGLTNLDNMEWFSELAREQPSKNQVSTKLTNTQNPKNIMITSYKLSTKWVDKEVIQAIYMSNASQLFIFFSPFFYSFLFFFSLAKWNENFHY